MSPPFFFGRQNELAALDVLLDSHRIVTVCGPAGVGKTALLREHSRRRPCTIVDLTEADAGTPIETYVAQWLGVSFAADADPRDRRRALAALLDEIDGPLALDNAEHVVAGVAALVSDDALASRQFVVASRARLGCADEHVVQLDPLEVMGDDPAALRYLVERAELLGATHAIRNHEVQAALDLVRRLDGLPLAMDLAAARLNLFRPAQLLERLERSSDVLSGSGARSLDEALATSWDASSDVEKLALSSLAILDGPFDPLLGEAVIGGDGLALLQQLRDRSVVVVDPDGRVRLLLSVRDFVRGRTDGAERNAALSRLALHLGARGAPWLRAAMRLDPLNEVAELRAHARHLGLVVSSMPDAPADTLALCGAALIEIAMLDGTPETTLALVRDLYDSVGDRGGLRVGIGRLERETGRYDEADASFAAALGVEALLERSLTAQYRGELLLARTLADQARGLANTDVERGRAELQLAGVSFHLGEYDDARNRFELAIRHSERGKDRRTTARALQNLGVVHTDQMRLDLARKCLCDAIESHRLAGDLLREAWGHNSLGVVELRAHDSDAGIAALERARELFDRIGHRSGAASTLANLAMIAVDTGRWEDGVRYAVDALERASSEEDEYVRGMSKLCLTVCTWLRGDREAAGRSFSDFECGIDREGHLQLGVSWDAAHGAYLAGAGDPRAEEVLQRGEARLTQDEGHDVYRAMFRLSRCHGLIHEFREGTRSRAELQLEILNVLAATDVMRSEPLRFTFRLIQQELPADWAPLFTAVADAEETEMLVAVDLQAFCPPGGPWQALGRSPSIWRLFEALARAREDGRGPMSQDELQDAVWPGEVLTVESAANRLHVSLSKLRKGGLKSMLRRSDDGYDLDPAIPIRFC